MLLKIHGAGNEPTVSFISCSRQCKMDLILTDSPFKSDHVARADKTAEFPEHEHGESLKGLPASGGTSAGLSQGPDAGQGGRGNK
jgi:hypothetical protein